MSVTRNESIVLKNLRKYALRLRLEQETDSASDWNKPEGLPSEAGCGQWSLEEKGVP